MCVLAIFGSRTRTFSGCGYPSLLKFFLTSAVAAWLAPGFSSPKVWRRAAEIGAGGSRADGWVGVRFPESWYCCPAVGSVL